MEITTIGLDIAKNVFQVHGANAAGLPVPRRKLRRADVLEFFQNLPRCLVGIEACGTAHHWAREITALGHVVKLLPPSYVKPYVKRGKTDAADAEAICEAVTRPGMRFVPVKTVARQSVLMLHRTRDLLVRQRTMLINAIRAHMAELGSVTAQGKSGIGDLMAMILGEHAARLPDIARDALKALACSLEELGKRVKEVEVSIVAWHRNDETSRRLATIPGVGPITASAIAAEVTDQGQFRSPRHFAAWIGLTPKQNSSGGKERQSGISKQGNRNLRRLLVVGATGLVWKARRVDKEGTTWLGGLLKRKPARVASIAQANKTARIVWALLTRGGTFRSGGLMEIAA
jgi:transposase